MAFDFRGAVTALGTWGIGKFQSMNNTIQNKTIALSQNASQIRTPSQPVTPVQSVTSLRVGPKYAPAPIPKADSFGGIPMSELNELARSINTDNYCHVDQYGFLIIDYKSNRGHRTYSAQIEVGENGKLCNIFGGPWFDGQNSSGATEFVRKANEVYNFSANAVPKSK